MYTLIATVVLAGPWIQDPNFPQPKQEAALNATLRLKNPANNGEGTAIRIGKAGQFVFYLTANHNLKDAKNGVDLDSYSGATYPNAVRIPMADIKYQWPKVDLAVLRANEPNPPGFLPILKDYRPSGIPFPALAVGCPAGNPPEFIADRVVSMITGEHRNGVKARMWQTDKAPEEGQSGGPIVDVKGNLVGICSGKNLGKGYYIHLDEIVDALERERLLVLLASPAKPVQSEK